MSNFLGEFECKLDDRNRLIVPAALLKQIPGVEDDGLVVNRGFEKHLVLYTKKQWDKITEEMSALNPYEEKVRMFRRYFSRGATPLKVDKSFRILLPQTLMEYAGIPNSSEVVISCVMDTIEVWAKSAYDEQLGIEPVEFSKLAQEVMGNKAKKDDGARRGDD
jgi:MraZ protein